MTEENTTSSKFESNKGGLRNFKIPRPHDGGYYEIRIKGHLEEHWSEYLGDLNITYDVYGEGDSLLSGYVPDQAALHGILMKIRDLGMPLISLKKLDTSQIK